MKSAALLMSLALALGQSDATEWQLSPRLTPGLELIYAGVCTEESLQPGVQFRRTYRLENQLLVLSAQAGVWDVAFMTSVSAREDGDGPRPVMSVRLEIARVHGQGRLAAPAGAPLQAPVSAPPLVETGCFVEAPAVRVGRNAFWEVAEEGRPPRSWTVLGAEACNGIPCVKLLGQQQSDDWDRPRADRTAWRRRDVVWLSVQLGVACKVERTVERRDPGARSPSHRTVTNYLLESRMNYSGRLFEDRRQEILLVRKFGEDAGPILRQPVENAARIVPLMRRVSLHLENHPSTPYRKAVVHLSQRIDSARKGELLLADYREEPPVAIEPLRVGQKVPDFVVDDLASRTPLRLTRLLGRPVLVVYYSPHTRTGEETLRFAADLAARSGDRLSVMAMAVTTDPTAATRQHEQMKLPFPVLDGGAMRISFHVEATPRFIVLDGEGYIRGAGTGWGPHVADEVCDWIDASAARRDAAAPNP